MESIHDPIYEDAINRSQHKDRLARHYLENLPPEDIDRACYIATKIRSANPLAETTVIIPVAAHQEEHTVAHAIEEYSRQITDSPFSLVLGLNTYREADQGAVARCVRRTAEAIKSHPELDIRTSFVTYSSKPTIGTVRYDLWNGIMMRGLEDGTIQGSHDIIGLNHDIDLVSLGRHYISRVQRHYTDPIKRIAPAYGRTRHAPDLRFPNISRTVSWIDFSSDFYDGGYEAGAIIPLGGYFAPEGGFDPSASTHEVGQLVSKNRHKLLLPTGFLQTSMRRYIDRIEHGVAQIWTSDTFTAEDQCRNPEFITTKADIDVATADFEIGHSLDRQGYALLWGSYARLHRHIHRQLDLDEMTAENVTNIINNYLRNRRAIIARALDSIAIMPAEEADFLESYPDDFLLEKAAEETVYFLPTLLYEDIEPKDAPVVELRNVTN